MVSRDVLHELVNSLPEAEIATAEPDKGLFRRKPVALRLAAVRGLAEARTPEALDALRKLHDDKSEDVRATAVHALERRAQQNG